MAVQEGDLVRFSVQYTDTETGLPFDPDSVYFSSRSSQGNSLGTPTEEIEYTNATTPLVGVIARLDEGSYQTFGDATGCWGDMIGKWRSAGVGQKVVFDICPVDRSLF